MRGRQEQQYVKADEKNDQPRKKRPAPRGRLRTIHEQDPTLVFPAYLIVLSSDSIGLTHTVRMQRGVYRGSIRLHNLNEKLYKQYKPLAHRLDGLRKTMRRWILDTNGGGEEAVVGDQIGG